MKIAIIGTHSTGKTTLMEHLHTTLRANKKHVDIVPEFARLCPFPINESTTREAQTWILEQQMLHEYLEHDEDTFLLCDRATIDNFAYMYRATNGQQTEGYEALAVDHMSTYNYVFKTTKLDIDPVYDKIRSTDGTFRQEIDNIIHMLLAKHAIPYHLLPATTHIDTHIKYILDTIGIPYHNNILRQSAMSLA